MRKTALGFLAFWAIPAFSYDLNAAPTINGLQLVDSYSQSVFILGAREVLSMELEVFLMLDGITGLSLILSEPTGISRIEQFDVIGPVSGGLFRAQIGQPNAVVERMIGPLSSDDFKNMNEVVLASKDPQVCFVFNEQDRLHSVPIPTIQRLRETDR